MSEPCPSCRGPAPRKGDLLCRECWHSVPRKLQSEVYSTFRLVRRTPNTDHVAKIGAIKCYRTAVDAATNAARKARFPEAVG